MTVSMRLSITNSSKSHWKPAAQTINTNSENGISIGLPMLFDNTCLGHYLAARWPTVVCLYNCVTQTTYKSKS